MRDAVRALVSTATEALKEGQRDAIRPLLAEALNSSSASTALLHAILQIADNLSEIDIAIGAARRLANLGSFQSQSTYWSMLLAYGRANEAQAEISRQPVNIREHPSTLYLLGKTAAEWGRFEEAESLFRQSLRKAPAFAAAWIGIAAIKKFTADDPDISTMEKLEPQLDSYSRATLDYALGKAWEDCGDADRAFAFYSAGAKIRHQQHPFDIPAFSRTADEAISGYTQHNLRQLTAANAQTRRALFVTGLPRSGTTLVEQVLRNHSAVTDGAEANLFGAAILPTRGLRFVDALAYQARAAGDDPWGSIAREYRRLLDLRFPGEGLVIDKSLGQSLLVGLLLHALPDARIAWLRRNPDDVALSCFATQFDSGFTWSWSLQDIADYMVIEDRLFAHWRSVFPERIVEVRYEDFVAAPSEWAMRLQHHFELPIEQGLEKRPRGNGGVQTASVRQVREPILSRFGRSILFERHLEPFRARYYI